MSSSSSSSSSFSTPYSEWKKNTMHYSLDECDRIPWYQLYALFFKTPKNKNLFFRVIQHMALVERPVIEFLEEHYCPEFVDDDEIPWSLIMRNCIRAGKLKQFLDSEKIAAVGYFNKIEMTVLRYSIMIFPDGNAELAELLETKFSRRIADIYRQPFWKTGTRDMKRFVLETFQSSEKETRHFLLALYYLKRNKFLRVMENAEILRDFDNYDFSLEIAKFYSGRIQTSVALGRGIQDVAMKTLEFSIRETPKTLQNILPLFSLYENYFSKEECVFLLERFINPELSKEIKNPILIKVYAEYLLLLKHKKHTLSFVCLVYQMCCTLGPDYKYRINVLKQLLIPRLIKKPEKLFKINQSVFFDALNTHLIDLRQYLGSSNADFLRKTIAPLIVGEESRVEKQFIKRDVLCHFEDESLLLLQFFKVTLADLVFLYRERRVCLENQHRKFDNFLRKKKFFSTFEPKECSICCETAHLIPTRCYHFFCEDCYLKMHENMNNKCGVCKQNWAFIF